MDTNSDCDQIIRMWLKCSFTLILILISSEVAG